MKMADSTVPVNPEDRKHPRRTANQELTQLALATGGSFVSPRTPEMKCRGPTVVNLSKGASARVDADTITTPFGAPAYAYL